MTTASSPDRGARLTGPGLAVLLLGLFLPLTDFSIVNVALPTMDRDLHASGGLLELVIAGYATAYAVLLVVGGRLGDAIGRRRLFMLGMAAFTVTSLVCGLAPTALILVLARVAQGASAAMLLPQVLSTVQAATAGEARTQALGYYGAAGGLATTVGQILGGVLVSADIAGSGWRPIFLVNVPVGLAGLVLARRTLPETTSHAPAPVDRAGTLLLAATLVALLLPLTEGRSLGWPAWTVVLLIAAPFLAAAFVQVERRSEADGGLPLVPLSVVGLPSMRRGLVVGLPLFAGYSAFMFVFALTVQDGAGDSPLATGLMLAPMAVAYLAASLCMPALLSRFGRRVLTFGAGLLAVGLLALGAVLLAGWPHPSPWTIAAAVIPYGFGQGLVVSPLYRLILSEVPADMAGVGSGALSTMQQSALGLGVAILGSLYLTEEPASRLGVLHAGVGSVGVLVLVALVLAAATRRLPDDTTAPVVASMPAAAAADPT